MTERRNKRPASANASDPTKLSKRRKNAPSATPDDAQSEPNTMDVLSPIPLRPTSSCSHLTPARSSVTEVQPLLAFSTANMSSAVITRHRNGVGESLTSSTDHINTNSTQFMSDPAHPVYTTTAPTPRPSPSTMMATPSTQLEELNHSRVSLVPTENSSDSGLEMDTVEFSFQDWESSLQKGTHSTSPQRLSLWTSSTWLGKLVWLMLLLLLGLFGIGYVIGEEKWLIQDAVNEMVAWRFIFETSPGALKHMQSERQLEAAVEELLTTSSALVASQRHVETMSKELEQVHVTVSQLEQELQTATENIQVTGTNLDATMELLNDAKSALQQKEQQLITLQHHMDHLEHELEHSQTMLRIALADLDGAVLGMGKTQVELDETMLLLQTTSARLQESEKSRMILESEHLVRGLELEGLRMELSNLQSMYALQAQELMDARFEVSSLSRTQVQQQLKAQVEVEVSVAELAHVRNELVETKALLSSSQHELLSAQTSHVQMKEELSSTVTELLETQSALQNAIEVLLEFEEEIDRLHERLVTQEKLATHTINFVSTIAIHEQQRAAAEVVNFMTTFAIRYQREAGTSESLSQEV